MLTFTPDDWLACKKELEVLLPESAIISTTTSGEQPVSLYVVDSDGNETLIFSNAQTHQYKFKLTRYDKLIFRSAKPFGMRCSITDLQVDEPRHDEPPVEQPVGTNLLAQIQNRVRQEMGVMREQFTQATGLGHEIGDDEEELFEEDLLARAQQKKKDDQAKARKDAIEAAKASSEPQATSPPAQQPAEGTPETSDIGGEPSASDK